MKKILLLLISLITFSFSASSVLVSGVTIFIGGEISREHIYDNTNACQLVTTFGVVDLVSIDSSTSLGGAVFRENRTWDSSTMKYSCDIVFYETSTTAFPEPTQVPTCDYVSGQYLNTSSNTCVDCSASQTVASRASCACDSQGSTYNSQAVAVTYTSTHGYTNYDRTDAKCSNGGYVPVFFNPRPVDNNSTTPTTPTTPPDTNGTGGTGTGTGGTGTGGGTGGTGGGTTTPTTPTTPDTNTSTGTSPTGATNYAELIAQLKTNNNSVNDFKDKFSQFATASQSNADKQLNATNSVKSAVDGTTSAVNTQGTQITNKLGDILNAIKDGNGTGSGTKADGNGTKTDGNGTNTIDLNETNKKLDTIHNDINKSNSLLSDIKGLLDFNASKYKLENMLPEGGESWFTSNALNLNFNTSSGNCYCQQAQFTVAGHNFVFPPQEALDVIPFSIISNIFMAFIYVLGLKNFLKS